MRVSILGGRGFVGSHVYEHLSRMGHLSEATVAPRIHAVPRSPGDVVHAAIAWRDANSDTFSEMVRIFGHSNSVINCAGLAAPEAADSAALRGANAVLPVVAYMASLEAGVRTFVHVSTAAVQGRATVLDESGDWDALSPYASAKALGEKALEEVQAPTSLRIYRATSVQGVNRRVTQSLVRLCNAYAVPVAGDGTQALPLSLVENTAAGICHISLGRYESGRYLHPWEGITVNRMVSLFDQGQSRVRIRMPRAVAVPGLMLAYRGALVAPKLGAIAKRADLLVNGQHPGGSSMRRLGFELPHGDEGYSQLAAGITAR